MKKFYSFLLILTALLFSGNVWGETLTVAETPTTTSDCIPLYGYWADTKGTTSQVIYSSDLLGDLAGGTITAMKFYASTASASWSGTWAVTLGTTTSTTLSGIITPNSPKVVYSGTLSIVSNEMTITFSEGFEYSGEENLLVEIALTKTGNCPDGAFYGISATAVGWCNKKYSAQNVLPKATFTYSAAAPETCAKPTTVEIAEENIGSNSATITLAGLNNATVEYKKKSATDYIVAETAVTGTSYELTGLDSYTEYDVQVKNVCGGTDGESKYVKASFRTKCGPKTIPFAEVYGFEDSETGSGKLPGCWTAKSYATSYYTYPYVGENSSWSTYSHAGSKYLYFYGGTSSSSQSVILPEMSADLKDYTLTFYYNNGTTDTDYSSFIVGYYETDGDPTSTFHQIGDALPLASSYTLAEVDLKDVPTTIKHLVINYSSGSYQHAAYVDDINIQVTPSCEKPTLNNATDQTFEGATFTWDGSAAQYQYAVVASGASVESWSEPTSEKTYTITGQAAATTFDFYVRSYCSSTEQSEGVKKSFTTATVTAPTNVIVSGETTDGANASWDAVPGISQYQYVVMEAGVTADWTSPTTVNTNAATISSLLPGQSYDLYVRSYYAANGATSSATPKKNFKTICEDISSIAAWTDGGFEESDANAVPNCWIAKTSDESNTYKPAMLVNTSYTYVRTGSKSLLMKAYNDSGEGYAIFPVISDASLSSLQLKFWQKKETAAFILKVGYLTNINDLSTFVELHTCANATVWTEETVDLSTLPSGARLAFYYFGTSGTSKYSVGVDDLAFVTPPSCAKPTTLNEAADITPEGATFSWEGDADFFQYICVAGGTAEGDIDWTASTKVTKAATNQVVLSGKAAGTYDFYVRSWCDESAQSEALKKSFTTETVAVPTIGTITTTNNSANASWTAPTGISYCQWSLNGTDWSEPTSELNAAITSLEQNTNYTFYVRSYYDASHQSAEVTKAFTTECDPIAVSAAEYAETFDDISSGIPACWKNNEGTTTNESYKWNSAASGQSGRCVRFESKENGSGKTNILASPLFELSADADLSFYVKNYKGGDYKVQIAVDGGAREDLFTDLTNIQNWTKKEAALTAYNGHTIQFFFCGTSNRSESSNGYLYLDEFKITPAACRKPASRPVASDVTANSATLTWGISPAAAYQYSLVEAGNAPAWEDIDTNTKTFDNLQPTTTYDFAVRSACGGADFSDTLMVSFRTDCGTYALPFEEDFDGIAANAIPECWSNAEGTSTDYYKWKGYTYGGTEGTNCVRFNSSTNDNGNTNILATPTIQLGESNLLTFYAKNPTGGDFKVQIKEEGAAEATDLLTGLTGIADWTRKYANIPADYNNKKVQILFHATSNEGDQNAYIYIDEVRVSKGIGLADNVDNSETLSNNNGQTLDVVVGRTFTREGYDTNPDHYNTICLPFSLSAEEFAASPLADGQLWAFKYAVVENEELLFRIVEADHIEAGKPYFIGFEAGSNIINPLFEDVTIAASVGQSVGDDNVAQLHGILEPETFTAGDQTKLFLYTRTNTLYWWNGSADSQLNGFRAFFQVSGGSSSAPIRHGMRARIVKEEQVITDVENVLLNNETIKRLEDNRVVIIRNGVKYNAQGQLISK